MYERLITRVPALPQDRHRHLPVRVLAARPGQDRRVGQVLPDHPRSLPALALSSPTPGWPSPSTASTSSRTTGVARAYEQVLKYPKSQLYDLALFKTAWCYWKLGDTNEVGACASRTSSTSAKKKAGKTEAEQKRAAELQGQALDYLVELFTEDDTKSAQDAFEFLAQIGGKEYSQKVLQAAGRHGLRSDALRARHRGLPPAHRARPQRARDAPDHAEAHRRVATSCWATPRPRVAEMRKLADDLRPAQRLGQGQQGSPQGRRSTRARWPRS